MDPRNTRNIPFSRYTAGIPSGRNPRNTRRIQTGISSFLSAIGFGSEENQDPQILSNTEEQRKKNEEARKKLSAARSTINPSLQPQVSLSSRIPTSTSVPVPVPAPVPAPAPAPQQSETFITSPNRFTNVVGETLQGYKHTLTENLADGDCFFSAIYRTLQTWDANHSGTLLTFLSNCNPQFITNRGEKEFIDSARNILADRILTGGLEDIYNHLVGVFYSEPETLETMMRDYQSYFQQIILNRLNATVNPSGDFYSLEEFSELVADEIRKEGTWVSALEVTLFKEILLECRILVDWYSDQSVVPRYLPKMYNNNFVLNIHVIRGYHYKHYVLTGGPHNINLVRLDHSFAPGITVGGKRKKMKTRKHKNKKRLNKSRKHK